MDTTAKKVVGVSLAAMCAFALAMCLITAGWFGTRYLQNVRYEQEVNRWRLEYMEAQAKMEAERKQAEWKRSIAEGRWPPGKGK